jgi:two-component system phosphate regulon sensor histidine kinase PhoR
MLGILTMIVAGFMARGRIGRELEALEDLFAALTNGPDGSMRKLATGGGDVGRLTRVLQERVALWDAQRLQAQLAVDRMHATLRVNPGGVLLVDSSGRIELANEAWCRMVPPRSEPIGKLPIEAFSVLAVDEMVRAALAGEVPAEQEASSGDVDMSIMAVPMEGGAMVFARDITRYRQAERARTDFVANVSHELRTPITAILGFSETALDESEQLPEQLARMIAAIHRNGKRLSHLFDDLLNLYRIETRRRQLPREMIRLKPLLEESVVVAVDRAFSQGQEFELRCPDGIMGWANPGALGAIVGNLASNACKYTPRGGRVVVWVESMEDEALIHVEDTGVGIHESQIGRIFERFYRVDDGRARAVGGTGLGLAIVKHLAMATNCKVDVRSEEGVGSVFTVSVPMTQTAYDERHWVHTLGNAS